MAGDDFAVQGRDELITLGRNLRAAADRDGAKSIPNALRKEVRDITKRTRQNIKRSALQRLPSGGGLNKWAAATPGATTLYGRNTSSVHISMRKSGHDIAALNRGRLRHPLYGNRHAWFEQAIEPGFFTDVLEAEAPELRRQILTAIRAAARRAAEL